MSDDKPTLPTVRELLSRYKNNYGGEAGGNLRIVLMNNNVHDRDLKHVRDVCIYNNDREGFKIAKLMLRMSKTQRSRLALEFHSL